MGKFYEPLVRKVCGKPDIVYIDGGVGKLVCRTASGAIERRLRRLFKKHDLRKNGKFFITIVWADKSDLMFDVWMYSQLGSWGSGALVDVQNFRNYERDMNSGVTAEYGLIMLGEEAKHRRGKALDEYIKGPRPHLPTYTRNFQQFYTYHRRH